MWSNVMSDTDWGFIELYILFSLTTAIVGLVQIFIPIQKKIKAKQTNNLITMSPIASNLLFVIHGVIASPLLFVVLIVPSVNHKFMDAMYESLASPD